MASTAKYHQAPQHDPEADHYPEAAPPSYQAAANAGGPSSADDDARLFAEATATDGGAARRSSLGDDDDIPDDFKYGGTIAEATTDIRNMFIRKVYAILSVQLLLTAGVSSLSFMSQSYKSFVQNNLALLWVSLIGSMVLLLLTHWKRKSYPLNLIFLGAFTLFEAYSISVVVSVYDTSVVLNAVILTAGIFVFLTAFACQTRYDFTSWQPYLFGGLWALILLGFMAAFMPAGSNTDLLYGGAGALLFSAYILVDTQLIMRHHHVEEEIAAAVSLYLDIINLFLAILRILNNQHNN